MMLLLLYTVFLFVNLKCQATYTRVRGSVPAKDHMRTKSGEKDYAYLHDLMRAGREKSEFWHWCGDIGQCKCTIDFAMCHSSPTFETFLRYIPRLPRYIHKVEFAFNKLPYIRKDFFQNVTGITGLFLLANNVQFVSDDAFDLMPNLTNLSLSRNPAFGDVKSLRTVLAKSSLVDVNFKFCSISRLPVGFLDGVIDSRVKVLNLQENSLEGILDLTAICPLQLLEVLYLDDNKIRLIKSSCVFKFRELSMVNNRLDEFILSCGLDGQSLFPLLETLFLTRNNIRWFGKDNPICLPNLKRLDLSENSFDENQVSFGWGSFPSLERLNLRQAGRIELSLETFEYSPVQSMDMTDLNLQFYENSGNEVKVGTFSTCRRLSDLNLSGNDFSSITDERFDLMFGHLPLVFLSLRKTQFSVITLRTFSRFTHLQSLNLANNKIVNIPDGAFDHMTNLSQLLLSKNKIATITEKTFSGRLRNQLRALSLQKNPFICSCDLLWFQAWLRSGAVEPFVFEDLRCANIPVNVADFSIASQACLLRHEVSVLIIVICVTEIITMTTTSLLFRYRWHIRLLLYEAFRGPDDIRLQRLQQNNFTFDVFVSYASQDLPWVRQHLMQELEDRLGFRLCIHERDFIPGKNIVDNIADCVESSKKILMVFSRSFVLSHWCQFELTYCLSHVMDNNDVLIVVCVDDVASREMTTAMMAVLKTTTYIQWAESDDAKEAFWGRLRLALNEIFDAENRV